MRAWKPFWLLLLPAWLVAQGLMTWVGVLAIGLLALIVPEAVLVALGVLLVLALLAGAFLLWRSAFNVGWRPMGYVGRVAAVAMVAAFAHSTYQLAAGKGELGQLVRGMAAPAREEPAKERRLLFAAQRGELERVKELLDAGEPLEARDTATGFAGRTPLHHAAGGGHYYPKGRHREVAALLIARGAEVNARAEGGYTPLHVAAGLGRVDVAALLLEKGADINATDQRAVPTTPLQAAVLQGQEQIVALLVERKADLKGALGVITLASRYFPQHTAILQRLLDAGADPNEPGQLDRTILEAVTTQSEEGAMLLISRGAALGPAKPTRAPAAFRLAEFGRVDALQLAFAKGFAPGARASDGRSLLHVATTPALVDLLLAKGLRVDAADAEGEQPLHHAVRRGNVDVIERLVARGARVNAANARGRTPLMLARAFGDGKQKEGATRVLDLLIAQGADPRLRDNDGYAALDVAAEEGDANALARLLEKGASATASDRNGYTALHRARTSEAAQALLAAGASARASALDGTTPLHVAAGGHGDPVAALLKSGAEVNAADKGGRTPLFAASRNQSVAQMLLDAGADVNVVDRDGKTALHYAAADNAAVAKLLLGKGAALDARDKAGNTPLHEAARRNVPYLVRALIELGADPQVKNRAGRTPEQLAQQAARAQLQKTFAQPAPGAPPARRGVRER
jgi:ankyrin repeat protein